jgi:hypothetical protein
MRRALQRSPGTSLRVRPPPALSTAFSMRADVQTIRQVGGILFGCAIGYHRTLICSIVGGRMAIEGDEAMEELDPSLQEGTLKMIARPWTAYIVKTFGATMLQQIESSIQRAVNGTALAKGKRPAA